MDQPFNPQWDGDRPRVDLISLGRRDLDEQRLALEAAEAASWRRFVAACPTFEQVGPLAAAHFAAHDEPTITDLLFGRRGCRQGADELRGRGIDGSGRARITDCPKGKREGYAAVGPGGGIVVVDGGVSARGRVMSAYQRRYWSVPSGASGYEWRYVGGCHAPGTGPEADDDGAWRGVRVPTGLPAAIRECAELASQRSRALHALDEVGYLAYTTGRRTTLSSMFFRGAWRNPEALWMAPPAVRQPWTVDDVQERELLADWAARAQVLRRALDLAQEVPRIQGLRLLRTRRAEIEAAPIARPQMTIQWPVWMQQAA